MRKTKVCCSIFLITLLVIGFSVSGYAKDGFIGGVIFYNDGTSRYTTPEEVQMHRNLVDSGVNPGEVEAIMRQQYFGDVTPAPATSSPTPAAQNTQTQAALIVQAQVVQQQAAQIQAAQQKALAANPSADPAAIYLQTLQANGYTLDATGKIVPIAK